MDDIINHGEAWSLAHMRSPNSNLARCYIELRELSQRFVDGKASDGDRRRITEIVRANEM